ncbi:MAG: hypothetical protein KDA63_15820 [Planctomycetales bacterium]|nr:hypothetical protein [Planctomycetales bacterium]
MAERFVTAVVWAEFDVLESISRGFRPENKALGMGDLALVMLFICVVSAIAWAVSRYLGRLDPQRPTHSPRALFAELARAHALSWSQRRLLRRLAGERQLPTPAVLFLEPQHFEASRLSKALQTRRRELTEIHQRLFATATTDADRRNT